MPHEPIAYTYEASEHCPACAKERFGETFRVRNLENSHETMKRFRTYEEAEAYSQGRVSVYGPFIAEDDKDNEGNNVGAVFSWDEWDRDMVCGTCGAVIKENEKMSDFNVQEYRETVARPGKFEGQAAYVPYFFDQSLDTSYEEASWDFGDGDSGYVDYYAALLINDEDRKLFEEIETEAYAIILHTTDSGFVAGTLYKQAEYEAEVRSLDAQLERENQQRAEDEARDEAINEARERLETLIHTDKGACDSCAVSYINGLRCHETGCPKEREIREAKAAVKRLEDNF